MKKSTAFLLAAGVVLAAPAAFANETDGGKTMKDRGARLEQARAEFDKRFAEADADHDGKLSREEAKAMPHVAENFDAIDTAKTGFVTKEQVQAEIKKRGAERRRAKQGG